MDRLTSQVNEWSSGSPSRVLIGWLLLLVASRELLLVLSHYHSQWVAQPVGGLSSCFPQRIGIAIFYTTTQWLFYLFLFYFHIRGKIL